MRNEGSIEIDRPIAEVFEYTNHNVADWSLVVVEDEGVKQTPEGVGSTFRIVTEDRGRRMEFEGVVTKWDPPRASTVLMRNAQFDIEAAYRFEELSRDQTRVTQTANVTAKGFMKIMMFCLGWLGKKSSCRAQENELANLKRLLEERASATAE